MATQPRKKTETMSLRIPAHRIEDLRLIGEIEEREIPWMLRRAIDMWCDKYFNEHPNARTQQAPGQARGRSPAEVATVAATARALDPVAMAMAIAKTERFKELVAEMSAGLGQPAEPDAKLDQPAELAGEPKAAEPKAASKAKPRIRFVPNPNKGRYHLEEPKGPAVAVPPTSFSENPVKHG
jgi:hypothetical protein